MSAKTNDTRLAEAVGSLEAAHEAITWAAHLFRTIYQYSKFELRDSANHLMQKLLECQKAAGIGQHLAAEFEQTISDALADLHGEQPKAPEAGDSHE
jgi:hypothetical protein